MLTRLVENVRSSNRSKRVSPGHQQLSYAIDIRFNQIPQDWQHIIVCFRRTNGSLMAIGSEELGKCMEEIDVSVEVEYADGGLC